jgi:MFS superfamily sulfate permease-like transporter
MPPRVPPPPRRQRKDSLLGDVVAGVSVAFVCVPQARARRLSRL